MKGRTKMKKISSILMMSFCMVMVLLFAVPMKTEAANVTNGTLGDNGGIQWTYEADTKTLTVTGEDTGLYDWSSGEYYSVFVGICPDVETIIMKNCKLYDEDCDFLFADLSKVHTITFDNFDTSQVTSMYSMFYGCSSLTNLDVSSINTSQVTNMCQMFFGCSSLTDLDLSNFDTSKVTTMSSMFKKCTKLGNLDVSNFDTSQVTDMSDMFSGCSSLADLGVSGFNTSNVTAMDMMFCECSVLEHLDVSDFDTSKVTTMWWMFSGCGALKDLDVSGFNTSQVTDMAWMFDACSSLTALDVSGFDTSKVTDMRGMFGDCSSVTVLDVSGFNTSQVTGMSHMFGGCSGVTVLDVSGFDTSKVTDMSGMFSDCSGVTALDVSGFDTSKVEDLALMFSNCSGVSALNVSGFNTSNTTDMSFMFNKCSKLTNLNINNFDTSQVTDMMQMFYGCSGLSSLDLSNFEITQIEDNFELYDMLGACDALTTIKTPKAMSGGLVINLPGIYADSKQNKTLVITNAHSNNTLVKSRDVDEDLVAFVERMFTVALERDADADGLLFYVEKLLAGDSNGACLAESFLCSPEFKNKNHDNAQYVNVLYATFFDREPAEEEVSYWVGKINEGQSRAFVLSGFVNSVEFDNLCAEYGISRGYMYQDGKPANPGLGRFAERLYTCVLGRAGEKDGIEYWTLQIAGGACTPKDAAKGFFNSKEYVNKQTTNEEYVENLYATFMDRGAGADEISYHVGRLTSGTSRDDVLEGFANAPEFENIMKSFGL